MPYNKPFEQLSEEEKQQLAIAQQVLAKGDSLHGPNLDHVNYTLTYVIHLLNKTATEHGNAVAYLELTRDSEGFGIAILNTREQSIS